MSDVLSKMNLSSEYQTNNEVFNFQNNYDDIPKIITILFSVYVITWYLEVGKRIDFLGQIRFEFILGSILGIIAVIVLSSNPLSSGRLPQFILLYFFFLLIHLPFSQDIAISWNIFFNRIVKFSFMALFICAFIRKPVHLKIFIFIYLLAFMKIGQEAFIGKITGSMVWENQGIMRLHGAQNTIYGHPASLAGVSIITLPFVYYLFPILQKWWKAVLLLQLIFVINITIFTGARTGYLAIVIMYVALLLRSKKKKFFIASAVFIAIIAVAYIPTQYKERFETIYTGQEKEGRSKAARLVLLKESFAVFLDNPLGVGMGGFRFERNRRWGKKRMDTHCLYTEALSEIGLLGFVVFFLFMHQTYKHVQLVIKNLSICITETNEVLRVMDEKSLKSNLVKNHLSDLLFMQAIANATLVFIITRLGLGIVGHDLYEIYWWFAGGLAIALYNLNTIAEKRTGEIVDAMEFRKIS